MKRVEEVATEAAQGNLEARLLHLQEAGDFAGLSRSVNHLLDMCDAFLREAGAALEYASRGKFFRRVLLRGMRGTFQHKSQLINSATETLARNASSLTQVEKLVSQSAEIASGVAEESRQASAIMKQLSEAFEKISSVVKLISKIAWKTNMLSMNATIEAARAGKAGLGFGVVAEEVKELAEQTSSAADEITREIETMHEQVSRTAKAILKMDETIRQLKDISATIEQAVVEQSADSGKTRGRVQALAR
jgi:methyl-accepting chemotaxis protein